jgi:hypothetical protein
MSCDSRQFLCKPDPWRLVQSCLVRFSLNNLSHSITITFRNISNRVEVFSSMGRKIARLPSELYSFIFSAPILTKSDLCTLATLSRSTQFAAERELYHAVDLRFRLPNVIRFCKQICASRRRARYVRRLYLDQLWIPFDGHVCHFTQIQRLAASALRLMDELRHLSVSLIRISASSGWGSLWILDGCKFNLLTFSTMCLRDEALLSFLSKQPNIRNLANVVDQDLTPLPPDVLCNLSVLYIHPQSVAAYLCANRPITHLRTTELPPASTLEDWPSMIALCVHTVDAWVPSKFPGLEILSAMRIKKNPNVCVYFRASDINN